jgi:hypothetical protein
MGLGMPNGHERPWHRPGADAVKDGPLCPLGGKMRPAGRHGVHRGRGTGLETFVEVAEPTGKPRCEYRQDRQQEIKGLLCLGMGNLSAEAQRVDGRSAARDQGSVGRAGQVDVVGVEPHSSPADLW